MIFKQLTAQSFPTKLRIIGLCLSFLLMSIAVFGLMTHKLNFSIEFNGGFITEFQSEQPLERSEVAHSIAQILGKAQSQGLKVSSADQHHFIVRQNLDASGQSEQGWFAELNQIHQEQLTLLEANFIGAQVGEELFEQGGLAMFSAVIMVLIYLALRFEWRLAVGAVAALFHDIVLVLGIFAWLQIEFDLTVLASLLAIIGYSLNDSIIVADRMRELMRTTTQPEGPNPLGQIINQAISSTLSRTLITSGTTLATIASIWLLAGPPLAGFSLALFSGIVVGTLSSICISATLPQLLGLNANHYQERDKIEQCEQMLMP
ncbi:preprotein translocase subunit SecF [Pseudoalteromonas ulvae UL12]|uniref:protein translocase subunit SecF n=1 Tax=Pseudoalteromonas ulvae TaxID=107327 RepID=UPI00186B7BBC|nr:protein translocase subunit SecF [Pseudoalteromonas ulvae]MBE0365880.1 preprotein translocase subunit SecF [Pseudoalteromonas ulvae UL12]